jgi:archaellum biogenesis protein FlaJ (TadC family)
MDLRPAVRPVLLVLGVSQIALALWMVADPASFFTHVGGFGARNDHYLRDVATFEMALGVVALIAVRRPTWQLPVLTFAALQFTLHALNHVRDAGKAVASTSGAFDAVSLGAGAVLFAVLAWMLARRPGAA